LNKNLLVGMNLNDRKGSKAWVTRYHNESQGNAKLRDHLFVKRVSQDLWTAVERRELYTCTNEYVRANGMLNFVGCR
jgi:hypothetical protein